LRKCASLFYVGSIITDSSSQPSGCSARTCIPPHGTMSCNWWG
jgi:hypothetical protein